MTDVIFKYSNKEAFQNRLESIGHGKHTDAADRHELRRQKGIFLGYPITDIHGDTFQRGRMSVEDADKFPPANSPAFSIVWRSDVVDDGGETLLETKAEIEAETTDGEGNIIPPRMQRVGTF
jgi:hypothetical protein